MNIYRRDGIFNFARLPGLNKTLMSAHKRRLQMLYLSSWFKTHELVERRQKKLPSTKVTNRIEHLCVDEVQNILNILATSKVVIEGLVAYKLADGVTVVHLIESQQQLYGVGETKHRQAFLYNI